MTDATTDETEPFTLGKLRDFLNNSGLPDDALLQVEEADIDDPRETSEALVVKVTASIGVGRRSTITFHSF